MKKCLIISVTVLAASLIVSVTVCKQNTSAMLCLGIAAIIITFFSIFEKKEAAAEKVVLIAILSSVASIGRIIFSAVGSVQPSSFIIMMTGIVFGGEIGFLTGAVTALASNLVLGQGPWTIWQMFCWGMMGLMSSALQKILTRNKIVFCIYGLLWGFLYGWIMNLWFLLAGYGGEEVNLHGLILAGVASFTMDLAHGISNDVLILFFSSKFVKIFGRISVKYGLKGERKNEIM